MRHIDTFKRRRLTQGRLTAINRRRSTDADQQTAIYKRQQIRRTHWPVLGRYSSINWSSRASGGRSETTTCIPFAECNLCDFRRFAIRSTLRPPKASHKRFAHFAHTLCSPKWLAAKRLIARAKRIYTHSADFTGARSGRGIALYIGVQAFGSRPLRTAFLV